jgi:hypothetical protein
MLAGLAAYICNTGDRRILLRTQPRLKCYGDPISKNKPLVVAHPSYIGGIGSKIAVPGQPRQKA